MNHEDDRILETLYAWQVDTEDVGDRVASAIAATPDLIAELRAMARELAALRAETSRMRDEIAQLRADLAPRAPHRLAPFTASESMVRLS